MLLLQVGSMRDGYTRSVEVTATGALDIIDTAQGNTAVLIWGVLLEHSGVSNMTLQVAGVNAVKLRLGSAGTTGLMLPVPIYSGVEPNVTVLLAGTVFLYYQAL